MRKLRELRSTKTKRLSTKMCIGCLNNIELSQYHKHTNKCRKYIDKRNNR